MAIVSRTLLWRNLWCKKEKRGFKEVYQLSDLSLLTSTPPTSLSDSHPSPSPLKFSLKATAHRVTRRCRGLEGRCWRRVIGQSERVGGGRRVFEEVAAESADAVWRKSIEHTCERPRVATVCTLFLLSKCVCVCFVEPPLCYPHRLCSWLFTHVHVCRSQ